MTGTIARKLCSGLWLVVFIILISPVSFVISGTIQRQQTAQMLRDQLIGTWSLVSMQNDNKVEILGDHPLGMLVFDRSGNYASQVMRSDLPKFASPDRTKATPEESQAVIRGYMGLFGTYTIAAPSTLKLHVTASSFPNWNGVDQTRSMVLQGDELELTNRTNSFGESSVHAFWRRSSSPQ